jgi:hypothetical protein
MPLSDLLQWLGGARQTGTLQIERNKVSKSIVFQDGQIIGCSSDDPPERLGQFLIARGKITEEQLCSALTIQESTRKHLGMTLVEMGALSPEELSSHLEAKAEETIFSLFGWDDAVFRFQQGTRDEANVFPIALRVEDVLLRGLQRYDELQRIRQVLYDPRLVLRQTDKPLPEAMMENVMACTLFEAIDGDRTVAQILLHVHGSEYVVTKFLFELYQNGFVELVGIKKIEPLPARHAAKPVVDATPQPAPLPETPAEEATDFALVEPVDMPAIPSAPASDARPRQDATAATVVAPAAESPREDLTSLLGEVEVPEEVEPAVKSDARALAQSLEQARVNMNNGEYENALEILDRLYKEYPGDESLRRLTSEAEVAFIEKAYRHFLPPSKIPRLTRPVEEMSKESMSSTEFFLLSRIDGSWDVKSIIQIAPLREADTLRTLKRMREVGIIELLDPRSS